MTLNRKLLHSVVAAICLTLAVERFNGEDQVSKPGLKQVQVPFSSLKPSATFKIGKTADWVLLTDGAVWVAGSKPYSVQRIDPSTNTVVAKVTLPRRTLPPWCR